MRPQNPKAQVVNEVPELDLRLPFSAIRKGYIEQSKTQTDMDVIAKGRFFPIGRWEIRIGGIAIHIS